MSIIDNLVDRIRKEIIRLKQNGYNEKEVRRFINKSYVKSQLNESDEFCFVGTLRQSIKEILQHADQIIKQEYYSEYNSREYYAPKIKCINVDTKYKAKEVGNVAEIEFDNIDKMEGKDIRLDYSTDGRSCNLEQKFTENGKLIATCRKKLDNEE